MNVQRSATQRGVGIAPCIDDLLRASPSDRPDALVSGDNKYPSNLGAHPSRAYNSGRVVVEHQGPAQAPRIPQGPIHPGQVPLSEVWGGNPWGSNDVEQMEPMPKATPSHGPKRARTGARPPITSHLGSQPASSSTTPPQQPEQERSVETDWAEVPIPDGAVEYSFEFLKEDLQRCRGKLVHTVSDPDTYTFAYDETLFTSQVRMKERSPSSIT